MASTTTLHLTPTERGELQAFLREFVSGPPQSAAVFCIDEKSAIQALDRLDPRLPLSPGRAEKHGFEYHRHGTLSLYAALNPKTGAVMGQTAPRHTSQEFVDFLEEVIGTQPAGREVHVILDNFAAHKTDLVKHFLQQHCNVTLHFTPILLGSIKSRSGSVNSSAM